MQSVWCVACDVNYSEKEKVIFLLNASATNMTILHNMCMSSVFVRVAHLILTAVAVATTAKIFGRSEWHRCSIKYLIWFARISMNVSLQIFMKWFKGNIEFTSFFTLYFSHTQYQTADFQIATKPLSNIQMSSIYVFYVENRTHS